MDPYLMALVAAAESGEECPPLWCTLTSGDLVSGTPTRSVEFVDASEQALTRRYGKRGGLLKRAADNPEALAAARLSALHAARDQTSSQYMTLAGARVRWGGRSDGGEFPALRVALDAVAVWWLAGGQELKASGGFFAGVAIPVGGGGS